MLRNVLTLLQQSGNVPLSVDTISRQLGLPRAMVDQLVHTLVQRGKLIQVDEGCTGCTTCPLKVVCAGAPQLSARSYAVTPSLNDHVIAS